MDKFFKLTEKGTNVKTEVMAGITTFMTMAYVLVLQPSAIIGFGGEGFTDVNGVFISRSALLVTCALISGLVTILMAFYANMPFALSTGMGTNFMFGAMLQANTISFGKIMAITLISGIIFVILTVLGLRDMIVKMFPKNIKAAIGSCIGFFIAYLGFKDSGIGVYTNGIAAGDFTDKAVLLAIIGLIIIAVLTAFKVRGAILFGILMTTLLGIPMGITKVPTSLIAAPDFQNLGSIFGCFDWSGILSAETLILIFVAFFGDFFCTLGTVLGVASKADMVDEEGNVPGIGKPFLVDAIGTCTGAFTGNTTITTYVESTAGVEAGGRTGLTALTTGIMFLLATFLAPLFGMVPTAATAPALIFVGFMMISGLRDIDFDNFSDAFGPFVMIMFGTFCGSIAVGIAAGILAHVFIKLLSGKGKELHPGMYVLCIPLILFFILQ